MKNWSNTLVGLGVLIVGTVLVQNVGLSQDCAGEITSKLSSWLEMLKWAPVVVGGGMIYGDRVSKGDVTLFGARKTPKE